jgi:cobaltochelatase CobS
MTTTNTHDELLNSQVKKMPHAPNREMHNLSLSDTFGITLSPIMKKGKPVLDANGEVTHKDKEIKAFKEPGPLTPAHNPHYKFPKQDLIMFLMALSNRDTIYLQGHSGTGKTEMVTQIASRLNYNVVQVNFDGHLLRGDLVGDVKIVKGATKFRYGLVPLGFTLPGTILLFDEVDAVAPETAFVLQRAVSGDRKMLLHETNELFELHPQNCITATANTSGMGDDSSLYVAGTNIQNFSFQNRWDTVMQIEYLSPEDEEYILKEMFPKADSSIIKSVVQVMSNARENFKGGKLSQPLTTRDSIRWLQKISAWPLPMMTAEYTFLNRMTPEDAMAVAEIIQRIFRLPKKDSNKYVKRSTSKKAL